MTADDDNVCMYVCVSMNDCYAIVYLFQIEVLFRKDAIFLADHCDHLNNIDYACIRTLHMYIQCMYESCMSVPGKGLSVRWGMSSGESAVLSASWTLAGRSAGRPMQDSDNTYIHTYIYTHLYNTLELLEAET